MINLSRKDLHNLELSVVSIVEQAGKYALKNWTDIRSRRLKNERDLVTNIDIEIEKKLRSNLQNLLPEAGFIVEEGKSTEKSNLNWTIDPIDGTKNYAFLYPLFSVQVALIYNYVPILGVVYNPASSQLFSSSQKNGVKLNNELIKIIPRDNLKSAIIDIDFGGNDSIINWKLDILSKIVRSVYRVRMSGGFANSYMLTGAFDATIYLAQQKKDKYIVDNAPRIILLREAGYQTELIENPAGKKIFLSAGPKLMTQLKTLILG